MPEWCQKRVTSIELKLRFGDGKHRFYLESVCASPAREGKLCDACRMLQVQTKTQDVRTFPHGFVLGEYPDESHIFDGPWYHSKVEAYGSPSATDVAMAMEAQRKARKGVPTKAMKELIDILVAGAQPADEGGVVVKDEPPVVVHAVVEKQQTVKSEVKAKSRAPAKAKSKAVSSPSREAEPVPQIKITEKVCLSFPAGFRFVESMDDPIEVELVNVCLKSLVHHDETYWHDEESQRVYEAGGNGKKGDYIGQWDPAGCCIVDE
jgi:hypothetical protein